MPKLIKPNSHEHWLSLRATDITSTEISALFGLSPYMTEFELFYIKSRGEMTSIADNERMKWGRRLEAVIANGIAEDLGMKVRRINVYMRHDQVDRMGSSFDYEIVSHEDGPGILEIKNVDGLVYRDKWEDDEAPPHIELQLQHQLEISGRSWGMIVALVGGNDPKIIRRERDKEVGEGLRIKVGEFWDRIAREDAPNPDYIEDSDFLIKLHQSAGVNMLDASNNELVYTLLEEYKHIQGEYSSYEKMKDAKKAEILDVIGDEYNKVVSGPFTLSCGMTKESIGTIITPEMIGESFGGRKSYRNFRVNRKKGA